MNGVEQYLDKHAVAYVRHEHEAVFTCKEADELRGSIKGMASKKPIFTKQEKDSFFPRNYILDKADRSQEVCRACE